MIDFQDEVFLSYADYKPKYHANLNFDFQAHIAALSFQIAGSWNPFI